MIPTGDTTVNKQLEAKDRETIIQQNAAYRGCRLSKIIKVTIDRRRNKKHKEVGSVEVVDDSFTIRIQ